MLLHKPNATAFEGVQDLWQLVSDTAWLELRETSGEYKRNLIFQVPPIMFSNKFCEVWMEWMWYFAKTSECGSSGHRHVLADYLK